MFIILQTIKEDLKQKHTLEMTQLLLKLSHPLSQLFKLVKLISSFEIVLRKVLFRLLCLKLMSLMIALKRKARDLFPRDRGLQRKLYQIVCAEQS